MAWLFYGLLTNNVSVMRDVHRKHGSRGAGCNPSFFIPQTGLNHRVFFGFLNHLTLLIAFVCIQSSHAAEDDPLVTMIDVDQRVYTTPLESSISISSTDRNIRFYMSGQTEKGRRLRYRLEGVDADWCDPPGRMRILVNFMNAKSEVVGSRDFDMVGQTDGWRYDVEKSTFRHRRETVDVPNQAITATISILSHGEDLGVGVVGVDNMRVFLAWPDSDQITTVELDTTSGRDMDTILGSPSFWYRGFGNRAEIAEIRNRPEPSPHPILVLNDIDPHRYGNWALAKFPIPVHEGQRFTLAWDTAHSIGRAGGHVSSYTDLKPGTYVFRTMLTEADGRPVGRQTQIQLHVEEPLHQRWYFWLSTTVLAAVAGTFLGLTVRRRVLTRRLEDLERRQSLQRERERIARDLHDNIGAGLTEIAMLSDLVHGEMTDLQSSEAGARVARIRQSAGELARSVDEIVWAINPKHDVLADFVNYLMQCSSQFLESASLSVRYAIPSDLPSMPITGKMRHNLFLVVREFLNNTVKYGNASVVHIEIAYTDGILFISVQDDGIGFDADNMRTDEPHNGIENMRRRIEFVGGTMKLITGIGRGTRIEVTASLSPRQVTTNSELS
jgi:signal transduction histidine kinase